MAILLIAEHDNASLSDQTAKALSAALNIGSDVHVLVAGKGAKAAADRGCKAQGRRKGAARRCRRTGTAAGRTTCRADRFARRRL